MDYDTRARATAARMLAPKASGGKGQAVTLKTKGNSTRNATTLTRTVSSTSQDTSGVEDAFKAFQIDGTQILAGDKRFMLSPFRIDQATALNPAPRSGDWLTLSGRDWLIVAVETVSPAGTAVMHTLQLRGAPA